MCLSELVSVEEVSTLTNSITDQANNAHREIRRNVWAARWTTVLSVGACSIAGRLYYIVHHAPLRHAWRLREKNGKMISYQRYAITSGVLGLLGFLFVLSPLGPLQRATEQRELAERLEAMVMRCLVLKENICQLRGVKEEELNPQRDAAVRIPRWEPLPSMSSIQVSKEWIWRPVSSKGYRLAHSPSLDFRLDGSKITPETTQKEWERAVKACTEMWVDAIEAPLEELQLRHSFLYFGI